MALAVVPIFIWGFHVRYRPARPGGPRDALGRTYLARLLEGQTVDSEDLVPATVLQEEALRELYHRGRELDLDGRVAAVREFLGRIHAVLNAIDAAPVPTIAAVHGVVFGGGFEVALACDLIIADRSARFAFPELRLGLIPGFGGIPRLKRDVGNALVRDLLLTGRSINATKALQAGAVSQVVGEGEALRAARAAAQQILKFDPETAAAAKRFLKPLPAAELREEIEIFVELFQRPVVQEALARFVDDEGPMPYLP